MDKAENDGVYDLYKIKNTRSIDRLWIDVLAIDDDFPLKYTTRESKTLNYTNWQSGQPNVPRSCAVLGVNGPKWVSANACQSAYDYACEKTLQSDDSPQECFFEDDVIFVENSNEKDSIEECQEFCQTISNCEVKMIT